MITIGLTGSIGMGKSTVAQLFARRGAKIISADAIVHALLAPGGAAVAAVAARFPAAQSGRGIDRAALARIVFADAAALREWLAAHPSAGGRLQ